jgi:hypothetical protein
MATARLLGFLAAPRFTVDHQTWSYILWAESQGARLIDGPIRVLFFDPSDEELLEESDETLDLAPVPRARFRRENRPRNQAGRPCTG